MLPDTYYESVMGNNKLYNFALQNNGGDAIEGVDISKYSTKIRLKTMMLYKQILAKDLFS